MPEEYHATNSPANKLEQLHALMVAQAELVKLLHQRIAVLEARLAKDSNNSSNPPSSIPSFNKPPPRSQRKATGRIHQKLCSKVVYGVADEVAYPAGIGRPILKPAAR